MVLTRAQNQPGPDGILGDDRRRRRERRRHPDATTRLAVGRPEPDLHLAPSHQVFLREYALDAGEPARLDRQAARRLCRRQLPGSPDGRRHGDLGVVKKQAAKTCSACGSSTRTCQHPDARDRPVRQVPPGPGPRAAAVRDRKDRHWSRATSPAPVPVPANVRALRHAVPDRHRAQRRPVARRHGPQPGDAAGRADARTRTTSRRPTSRTSRPARTTTRCCDAHFAAGDGRVNENIALTADPPDLPLRARPAGRRHQEHARRPTRRRPAPPRWPSGSSRPARARRLDGERLFQAARFVTEMEYQHLVFEEFARKVQPAIRPFHVYSPDINPAIPAEFAHAVYRFGHSMLDDTVARTERRRRRQPDRQLGAAARRRS